MQILAKILFMLATLNLVSVAFAKGGSHFGAAFGTGLPYLTSGSLIYVNSSNKFSASLDYNLLSLTSGLASVSLTKPEIGLKWHPFAGAFYVGAGLGQMSLKSEATDLFTSETASIEVTAMTITPSVGWMWGVVDGGLFLGVDIGLQNPMSPRTTITTSLPATEQAYLDAETQANTFGKTAFTTFSIKLGYLF